MKQKLFTAPQGANIDQNGRAAVQSAPAPEVVIATSTRVGCDGGAGASQGALGHPLVYMTLVADASGGYSADCPYCDRHFVLAVGAQAHH